MKRRVLVVDDEPGMLRVVQRVLEPAYEVDCTQDPEEALDRCRKFKPQIAILDIRMPGIDGFELMARLKEAHPPLSVILMTGSLNNMDKKLIRAIREKAFYFIQKPFDREVLQTLVDRCFELYRLAETNRSHVVRMEGELDAARAFQQSLLPETPARVADVSFDARYVPCDELGGDFFDFMLSGPERVAFLIVDVSGHGAAAAMLTGIVKSAFQSSCRDAFGPLDIVRRIAAGMGNPDEERFVTLFCGCIDPEKRSLQYVNAGHPPPILWDEKGRYEELARTGPMVLSGFESAHWRQERTDFPKGTRLLLYTDGIPEVRQQDEMFGTERLHQLVRKHGKRGSGLLGALLAAATDFSKGRPVDDDMTLLQIG